MKRIFIATALAASTTAFGGNTVELKAGLENKNDNIDAPAGDGIDGATNQFAVLRAKWKQTGAIDAGYSYTFRLDLRGVTPDYAYLSWASGAHTVHVGAYDSHFGGVEDIATSSIEREVKSDVYSSWAGFDNGVGVYYSNDLGMGKVSLGLSNNPADLGDGTSAGDTQAFGQHFKFNGSFMGGNLLPVVQYSAYSAAEGATTEKRTFMSLGLTYNVAGAAISLAQHTDTVTPATGDAVSPNSMYVGVKYKTGDYRPYLNYIIDDNALEGDFQVKTTTTNVGVIHDCGKGVGIQADYASSVTDEDNAEAETTITIAVNAKIKG
jgi:hypothetical protein